MMKQRQKRPTPGEPQRITKAVTHIRLLEVNPGKLTALDALAPVYLTLCQQYVTLFCSDEAPHKFRDPVFATPLVVVTFSDRLTRFGLSYLRSLFSGYGVTLTVLHPDDAKTPEQELTEDLFAMIASFAGRMSGVRLRRQKAFLACARQVLTEQEE